MVGADDDHHLPRVELERKQIWVAKRTEHEREVEAALCEIAQCRGSRHRAQLASNSRILVLHGDPCACEHARCEKRACAQAIGPLNGTGGALETVLDGCELIEDAL